MSDFSRIKSLFFDRDKVKNAVDLVTRKNLSQAGAFVRTAAQTSMRYSKKSAEPGEPPKAHRGNPLLRKLLFFSYDASSRSVVIGPLKFKTGIVPRVMEEGGRITQRINGVTKTMTYAPHPYMGPALAKERPQLANRWKDSIRG
jgi:hypothetical protein